MNIICKNTLIESSIDQFRPHYLNYLNYLLEFWRSRRGQITKMSQNLSCVMMLTDIHWKNSIFSILKWILKIFYSKVIKIKDCNSGWTDWNFSKLLCKKKIDDHSLFGFYYSNNIWSSKSDQILNQIPLFRTTIRILKNIQTFCSNSSANSCNFWALLLATKFQCFLTVKMFN